MIRLKHNMPHVKVLVMEGGLGRGRKATHELRVTDTTPDKVFAIIQESIDKACHNGRRVNQVVEAGPTRRKTYVGKVKGKSKTGRPLLKCPYCPKTVYGNQGLGKHLAYKHPKRKGLKEGARGKTVPVPTAA